MPSTLFLSLFPSYPTRSAASRSFVLPGVLREIGSLAAVFFSHPDESSIVAKIIATNVNRNAGFMSLTKKREDTAGCRDKHTKLSRGGRPLAKPFWSWLQRLTRPIIVAHQGRAGSRSWPNSGFSGVAETLQRLALGGPSLLPTDYGCSREPSRCGDGLACRVGMYIS